MNQNLGRSVLLLFEREEVVPKITTFMVNKFVLFYSFVYIMILSLIRNNPSPFSICCHFVLREDTNEKMLLGTKVNHFGSFFDKNWETLTF